MHKFFRLFRIISWLCHVKCELWCLSNVQMSIKCRCDINFTHSPYVIYILYGFNLLLNLILLYRNKKRKDKKIYIYNALFLVIQEPYLQKTNKFSFSFLFFITVTENSSIFWLSGIRDIFSNIVTLDIFIDM